MSKWMKRARRLALAALRRARIRTIRATERRRERSDEDRAVNVALRDRLVGGQGRRWVSDVAWSVGCKVERSPRLSADLLEKVPAISGPWPRPARWAEALRLAARAVQRDREEDLIAAVRERTEAHLRLRRELHAAAAGHLHAAIQRVLPPGVQLVAVVERPKALTAELEEHVAAEMTRAILGDGRR